MFFYAQDSISVTLYAPPAQPVNGDDNETAPRTECAARKRKHQEFTPKTARDAPGRTRAGDLLAGY